MPRGGKRPGCGPKRDANGKALNPYKPRSVESSKRRESSNSSNEAARTPVVDAKVVSDNRRQPMFSDASIMAILETARELADQAKKRPRTLAWNPYVIRNDRFGPVWDHIQRSGRKRQLAMDDNAPLSVQNQFAIQAWQTGGIGPNDATDGMLFLGYPYLSELSQRAEFRLFGEITSEEMTRKWIDIRGTDDESTKEKDKPKERNKDDQEASDRRLARDEGPRTDGRNKEIEQKIIELRQFADEMKIRQWFKSVDAQDQYFGISHLYLQLKGANIDDLHDPENRLAIGNGRDVISENKLGRGCLLGMRTIEPVWCYPIAYNASNPLSPDWYDPQVWYVMGAEVHKTRLMPFISRPIADILKPAYAFGGLPMTQMAQAYVDIWLRTRESIGELIHAFSVMVLKTNLGVVTQPGGSGGAAGDLLARIMLANTVRDNQGTMVIDKNTEDFVNISAPISGLDHLQAQAQEHMYSVARIPAVKWTGIQPTGLNATSEGELRAFNDTIHGRQESFFRNGLTTVLDIMQISLWGKRDEDITYDFEPLHELTEKEKAEVRKMDAETAQIRIDTGIISQEEERARLVADPDSGYHGLDPDDVPELLEEEQQGLIPEGAGKGLQAELEEGGGAAGGPPGGQRRPGAPPSKGNGARRPPSGDRRLAQDAEWHESDHPRRSDGKFGRGGGGGAHIEPHKSGSEKEKHRITTRGEKEIRSSQMGAEPGRRESQMGERRAAGARAPQMGEKEKRSPGASQLFQASTKTADQIVAGFPGGKEAIQAARERLAKQIPTNSLVADGGFKNPDGTYTPERRKIHHEIVDKFFPADKVAKCLPAEGEKPVITMLGGRGGSGKSWLSGNEGPINAETSILIDSDAIKAMLPEYKGWNASVLHEESDAILDLIDEQATALGVNVILDMTMKSEATAVMRLSRYEALGYEAEGYYMYASPETAATRAMSRYAKGGKFTGRFVPPEVILGNVNNEKNFDKLSNGFRKWAVYDNEGTKPRLISRSED